MDNAEYAKLNHKKKQKGKPQQTRPHLEAEPSTIVYADIRNSHIQLPVEDPKHDVTENTGRCVKCGNITKILTILIVITVCCALTVLICKKIMVNPHDPSKVPPCNSTVSDHHIKEEIRKILCVNSTGCMVCPSRWLWHNESCYYFSSGEEYRTWKESREECEEMGAHLLVIEDREQKEFINRFSKGQGYEVFWIGLYRDGDGWRWVDGGHYDISLLQISGKSSGDCVLMNVLNGYNKDDCQSKLNWICEKRSLKI